MSHPGSHSEAFGLRGQDQAGFPTEVVGKKEGAGVLGGAGHPTGEGSSGPSQPMTKDNPGREGTEGTVGGMKHGTDDSSVPGAGGSVAKPSQGSGKVSDDHSTADILNPMK